MFSCRIALLAVRLEASVDLGQDRHIPVAELPGDQLERSAAASWHDDRSCR
jgi:hypothetical protein